ncbi:hypothetical protein HYDPIDRAFT_53806, partial [Hydnomerulius pinastri MD-312]
RAPQLQLLEEWCLHNNIDKFCHKLQVCPDVFSQLVGKISNHPVFMNRSNNQQLPVPIQLAILLNGLGHYGDWAGVS